jgi:hypothetical protein
MKVIISPIACQAVRCIEYPVNAFLILPMTDRTPKTKRRAARNPERMDMHTVARMAKVSIATVSRTINHVPTVNAKMAKRVWEAIKELDYHRL